MERIKKIYRKVIAIIRKIYKKIKRIGLKNTAPTIISNNCTAGIIYHDLFLRFLSPTINLFISEDDYLTYLENFEDFQDARLTEAEDESCDYPIGILTANKSGLSVKINFMHYDTFAQAYTKWFERSSRINFDNLYIIFEGIHSDKSIERFDKLPFRHKVFITSKACAVKSNSPTVILDLYDNDYYQGKIINYPKILSYKRYLDSFDYIKFLNS